MDIFEDYEKDLYDNHNVVVKIRPNTFGDWCWMCNDLYFGGFTSWMEAKINASNYFGGVVREVDNEEDL